MKIEIAWRAAIIPCLVLGGPAVVRATIIADSVAEFSGVQGQDNWYYGYWDRTSDSDGTYDSNSDFQLMGQYLTEPSVNYGSLYVPAWYVQDGSYWTTQHATGGIPNGLDGNQGRRQFEHWSIRRWVSEVSGQIQIDGLLSYQNLSGQGFVGRIRVDGVEVWSQFIGPGDFVGVSYAVLTFANFGSKIDLMIDPFQSSDISDHIRFTATMTPEPGTMILALFPISLAFIRPRQRMRRPRSAASQRMTHSGLALAVYSICGVCFVPSTADAAIVIADSVAEFSGVQGQSNWFYGYWDRTLDADGVFDASADFQLMSQYIAGPSINFGSQADTHAPAWFVQDGSYWTALWRDGGHPNGTNGNHGRLPFEHWTTRRWVSEVSGPINISGIYATHPSYGGQVDVRIRIDGIEVWTASASITTPTNYDINVLVNAGSFVDFMIDPHQSIDVSDQPYFTATITPEPGTVALLALPILGFIGCRRRPKSSPTRIKRPPALHIPPFVRRSTVHLGLAIIVLLFGMGTSARAGSTWTQWSGNGHYYKAVAVPQGITWDIAQSQAVDEGGYLATITSAAENDFVFSLIAAPLYWNQADYFMGPWLGGFQAPGSNEPNGGWQWTTGEAFGYTNWYPGEPNDNPNESYLHFSGGWGGPIGSSWNDATIDGTGRAVVGYVVESTVPEPASGLLVLAGAIAKVSRRYGRRVASFHRNGTPATSA